MLNSNGVLQGQMRQSLGEVGPRNQPVGSSKHDGVALDTITELAAANLTKLLARMGSDSGLHPRDARSAIVLTHSCTLHPVDALAAEPIATYSLSKSHLSRYLPAGSLNTLIGLSRCFRALLPGLLSPPSVACLGVAGNVLAWHHEEFRTSCRIKKRYEYIKQPPGSIRLCLLIQHPRSSPPLTPFDLDAYRPRSICVRRQEINSPGVLEGQRSDVAAPRQLGRDGILRRDSSKCLGDPAVAPTDPRSHSDPRMKTSPLASALTPPPLARSDWRRCPIC